MRKKYIIEINEERIGYTLFEYGDPPMGVVFGKVVFDTLKSGYAYLKKYCAENNVIINDDDIENKLINTQDISGIIVSSENGAEIKGIATSMGGMDSEGYEIEIIGIPYPFYGIEFPEHVNEYDEKFK